MLNNPAGLHTAQYLHSQANHCHLKIQTFPDLMKQVCCLPKRDLLNFDCSQMCPMKLYEFGLMPGRFPLMHPHRQTVLHQHFQCYCR